METRKFTVNVQNTDIKRDHTPNLSLTG